MNSNLTFQSSFCHEYDMLLHECESAQRKWAEWREDMNLPWVRNHITRDVSGELLRLQAKFAKAYARLEKHNRECEACQFVARMSEQQRELSCLAINPEQTRLA